MITKASRLKQKCILYLVSRNASQNPLRWRELAARAYYD